MEPAGGDIGRLWELVNIPEAERPLVPAWMLEAWRQDTPFPGLELCSVHGSAKMVEDAFVFAGKNWLVSLDNVSHLRSGLQDAFCI